jgi:hypothetical protein
MVAAVTVAACMAFESPARKAPSPATAMLPTTTSQPAEPKSPSPATSTAKSVDIPVSPAVPLPPAPLSAGAPLALSPVSASDQAILAMSGQPTPLESGTEMCGTAIDFVSSPAAAAQLAQQKGRLQFILHVSGHFEDSAFT